MKIDSNYMNEQIDEYRQNYKIDGYEFYSLYELTGGLKTIREFTELVETIFQKIRSFEDGLINETFLQFIFPLDSDFTEYDIKFEKLFYFVEENIDDNGDALLCLNECNIMNNCMLTDMFMSFVLFNDGIHKPIRSIVDYDMPQIKKYNTISYFKLNKYEDGFLNYCYILIFPPENKIANSYLNNGFIEEEKSDKMIINYDYIDDLLTGYTRFMQDRHYEDGRLYMYSSRFKTLDEFIDLLDAIFQKIRSLGGGLINETFLTICVQVNEDSNVMPCFQDLFLLDDDSYSKIECSIAHNQFLQKSHISFISSDNLEKSSIKIIPYKYNKIKKYKTIYYSVEADNEAGTYKSLNMEIFPPENKIHKGFSN